MILEIEKMMRRIMSRARLFFFLLFTNILNGGPLDPHISNTTAVVFFNDSTSASFGSGFFVIKEFKPDDLHILLITNKHVLPKEGNTDSVILRVNSLSGDSTKLDQVVIPITGLDGKYLNSVAFDPDSGDISVVDVTPQYASGQFHPRSIGLSFFYTKDSLKANDIRIGDEIFLLGYPDAIYDERNASPILRTGIIASDPTKDFFFNADLRNRYGFPESIDGFLIDANVFPGSSGSLVVLKPQSVILDTTGDTLTIGGPRMNSFVIGIVSGSIPIMDSALGSWQRMGLGIVYSADAILRTIGKFKY